MSTKSKKERWLTKSVITSLSDRPPLRIDDLEEDEGTAIDTARYRPTHPRRVSKKVSKKLAELEEWVEFIKKKSNKK